MGLRLATVGILCRINNLGRRLLYCSFLDSRFLALLLPGRCYEFGVRNLFITFSGEIIHVHI